MSAPPAKRAVHPASAMAPVSAHRRVSVIMNVLQPRAAPRQRPDDLRQIAHARRDEVSPVTEPLPLKGHQRVMW